MRRGASRAFLLALGALALGCSSEAPDPVLRAVEPNRLPAGRAAQLTIRGEHFSPRIQADFDSPGASRVWSDFTLTLSSGQVRLALEGATLLSGEALQATLPASATPAVYDIELTDPRGHRAFLPAALAIYGDSAPTPCFTVTPAAVLLETDGSAPSVHFDASCSSDVEDGAAGAPLSFQFDFGDGTTGAGPVTDHAYTGAGLYEASVEVTDSAGFQAFASRYVSLVTPASAVQVTTAADENDPGATPGTPGGSGFSLREAIQYVNGHPGEVTTILFQDAYALAASSQLPALTAPGVAIVGPGVSLELSLVQPCLTLDGPNQTVLGLRVGGCAQSSLLLTQRSDGSHVAECVISGPAAASGIDGRGSGLIGPRNDLSGLGVGIQVNQPGYTIDGNRVHGNEAGILILGAKATVQRNAVYANASYGLQATGAGLLVVRYNVFDANGGAGAVASGGAIQGNLFTGNGSYGLVGGPFDAFDHNGLFGNAAGPVNATVPLGPTDVLADPLYLDSSAGDYRLLPLSPCVDRGIDLGLDLNGPAPGSYFGLAPDLGASETPYSGGGP